MRSLTIESSSSEITSSIVDPSSRSRRTTHASRSTRTPGCQARTSSLSGSCRDTSTTLSSDRRPSLERAIHAARRRSSPASGSSGCLRLCASRSSPALTVFEPLNSSPSCFAGPPPKTRISRAPGFMMPLDPIARSATSIEPQRNGPPAELYFPFSTGGPVRAFASPGASGARGSMTTLGESRQRSNNPVSETEHRARESHATA